MTRLGLINIIFDTYTLRGTCPFMHACKDCKYDKDKPNCSEAYWDEEVTLEELKERLSRLFPGTFS